MSDRSSWDNLAEWWADEVHNDPSYRHDVLPMLGVLTSGLEGLILDLGCGEGAGMRQLAGSNVIGVDLSRRLLRRARAHGPVVLAHLPELGWLRDATADAAVAVYLLDLISGFRQFFAETARIVRPAGALVVLINHPLYTAPGSAPLLDEDGELFWRWGSYFAEGSSAEPAGRDQVTFHHRPIGMLLNAAADSGWALQQVLERGLGAETTSVDASLAGQGHVPRLLGLRWQRLDSRQDAAPQGR